MPTALRTKLTPDERKMAQEAVSLIFTDHATAGMKVDKEALLADGNYDLFFLNYFPDTFYYVDHNGDRHPNMEPINYTILEALENENQAVMWLPGGTGKDLAVATPILTTKGWKTMVEVEPGDEVFGSDGKPTKVVAVSEIFLNHECYELTFADGAKITAGSDHLWYVFDEQLAPRRQRGAWHIYTTQQLVEKSWKRRRKEGTYGYRFKVKTDTVIDHPVAELPADPYIFGYWLGDGNSDCARITCGDEDLPHLVSEIERSGYSITGQGPTNSANRVTFNINANFKDGFISRMNRLGVTNNKHIPAVYMCSSIEQRMALLAGLMDSDGCADKQGGVQFTVTSKRLAEDVQQLLRSLGERVAINVGKAMLRGRYIGPKYVLSYTPHFDPFRLKRKSEKLGAINPNGRRWMSITNIERVPSVPTCCITVENPDGMYLVGKLFTPTHNSSSIRRWLIYVMCREPQISMIYVEKTDPTVRQVARSMLTLLETNDELRRDFGDFRGSQWSTEAFTIAQRPNFCEWPTLAFYSAGGSAMLGKRCNICIVDDPVTSDNSQSDLERGRLLQWYNEQPATAPSPLPITRLRYLRKLFLIGTTFHMDDLFHKVLERGGYKHIYLKAVNEQTGECLAPMRFCWRDPEELKRSAETNPADQRLLKRIEMGACLNLSVWRKEHGTSAFLKRYQNEIIDPDKQRFPREWFDGCSDKQSLFAPPGGYPGCMDEEHSLGDEREEGWTYITGVDPAAGTHGPKTVRFACVTLGCNVKKDPNLIRLVDYDFGMQPMLSDNPSRESQVDIVLRHVKKYGSRVVLETNNVQGVWAQAIRQEARNRGVAVNITGHYTSSQKKVDPNLGIEAMAPMVENGYLRLPAKMPSDRRKIESLIEEFVYWGVYATDDILMATWFAWRVIQRAMRAAKADAVRTDQKPPAYWDYRPDLIFPPGWSAKQKEDYYKFLNGGGPAEEEGDDL